MCETSRSASGWSSHPPSLADTARIAAPDIMRSATTPTQTVRRPGPRSLAARRKPGRFDGLQAEYARIPFANVGLVKLPNEVTDDQAILISDIFPTAYFGADIAGIKPGDTVAVWGCGPVGQFTILSALMMDAGRVIAIDHIPSRLEMAKQQGAEVINFEQEHPVETIQQLTGGIGVDRAIDAVGIDAQAPRIGPGRKGSEIGKRASRNAK